MSRWTGALCEPQPRCYPPGVRLPEPAERGTFRDELRERTEWLRSLTGSHPTTGR